MKCLKKLFIILFVLYSLLSTAYAKDYKCENDECMPIASNLSRQLLLDGLYIGGQLGYDTYWVRENISRPIGSDLAANPKINASNWIAGGLLGFGKYIYCPFYLGGEVYANYSHAHETFFIEDTLLHYSSKFSARGSFGFALLPGIGITDYLLLYARLGYGWGNFIANESIGNISIRKTNTVSGPQYGLGMEVLLMDYWSLRVEYTHINHSSFSSQAPFQTNFDPSTNQIMVAIIYHFWPCCC